MTNTAFVLSYTVDTNWDGPQSVINLFLTRELAEARIVREVLDGKELRDVKLTEAEIEGERPKTLIEQVAALPAVVEAMRTGKKIQAIKAAREAIPGTGLKDAKDAVEAAAAQGLLVFGPYVEPVRIPVEPVHSFTWSHFLQDEDGDTWIHVGEGKFRMLKRWAPVRQLDESYPNPLTYSEVQARHRILAESDIPFED